MIYTAQVIIYVLTHLLEHTLICHAPCCVCILQEELAKRFLIVLKDKFFKHLEATVVEECISEFGRDEKLTTQEIKERLDVSGNKR